MMRLILPALIFLGCHGAWGQGPPAGLEFSQRLGAPLPLELALRDEGDRAVRLGDYFGGRPVVLVLGYFDCPNLCSTLLDGVLESLARTDLPPSAYRLLAVSIDPREGAAAARRKEAAHRFALAGLDAHFLTGAGTATGRLAAGAGFPYAWDEVQGQYQHPAGFLVAAPDGRIARYFLGVRFAPRELEAALGDAAAGHPGAWSERLLLLCAHYDPRAGRHSVAAMAAVRAVGLLLAAALGLWIWRRRGGWGA